MKQLYYILLMLMATNSFSQSYFGYDTDNYSGIHGVAANPANIADSRVKLDINLYSLNATAANDYIGLSLENITQLITGDFSELNTISDVDNSILVNTSIFGPSFMFSINEKHSVGVITKLRMDNTFNNISGTLFSSLIDSFGTEDFSFNQNAMDATTHIWGEVGVSYGRVLFYDYDNHYLKGGVTLKYLVGAGIAQANTNDLSGNFSAATRQLAFNGSLDYLISYDASQEIADYTKNLAGGVGMDIGFVYEYRTRSSRIGDSNDNPRALNKYRAKIAVSVLDYGAITYDSIRLTRYTPNRPIDVNNLNGNLQEVLDTNFSPTSTTVNATVALPTSLRINVDYKIIPWVYANLDINQALVKTDGLYNTNGLNHFTFTPRFETRVFSAYLPVTYSELGGTSIGAGVKLGPLIIGSGSILSNLISDKTQMANVFLAFKAPINHKRK